MSSEFVDPELRNLPVLPPPVVLELDDDEASDGDEYDDVPRTRLARWTIIVLLLRSNFFQGH